MDNQTLQKLKDAITKSNSIAVAVRANPSLDQMAAALGMSMLLKEVNKTASVACPTDPIVEISNLVGINKVQKSLGGGGSGGDLVVSFPYLEGEIEKVSYTLENGFLNIIVKAAEQGLSFSEKDVRYTRGGGGGGPVDLLFVVGAQSLADLGNLYDPTKMQNTQIVNIDNSDRNEGYGDVVLVSPQASSVSEIIGDIALSLGFKVERDAAQNLMSGLTTATQNFQNPRSSSLAFEVASYLMKRGAARTTRPQVPAGQDDFAAQFLNRPAPQPQQQQSHQPQPHHPQPQPRPQPQMQPRPQAMPQQQPRPQAQPTQPQSREDQLRQQLREEAQRNGQQPQQPQQNQQNQQDEAAPVDWLTPKVYKGSSNF